MMKTSSHVSIFVLLPLMSLACAGASGPQDKSKIIVPPQPAAPPPSTPTATATTPTPDSSPVATAAFKCDGANQRFEVGPRSYCAYADGDTWEASEHRCVDNGGHLMSLDSSATSDAVHKALGSPLRAGRAAWIGLELKTKGKKDWKWATGEAVTQASWRTTEPNNFDGNEQCGEWLMASGLWNDTRCELRQPYLCQSQTIPAGVSGSTHFECRGGRSFEINGTSYCLNMIDRNYADAKRACTADGGLIAVPKTTELNKTFQSSMAARFSATRMWIGLTNNDDNWAWASGAAFDYQSWHPGEPNNFNGENCVELFAATWTWNDLDCGVKLPSVCESPAKKH